MVKHELRVGSTIQIGDVTIRLDHKSGQRVSLVIDAPREIKIYEPKNDDVLPLEHREKAITLV